MCLPINIYDLSPDAKKWLKESGAGPAISREYIDYPHNVVELNNYVVEGGTAEEHIQIVKGAHQYPIVFIALKMNGCWIEKSLWSDAEVEAAVWGYLDEASDLLETVKKRMGKYRGE